MAQTSHWEEGPCRGGVLREGQVCEVVASHLCCPTGQLLWVSGSETTDIGSLAEEQHTQPLPCRFFSRRTVVTGKPGLAVQDWMLVANRAVWVPVLGAVI